MKKLYWILAFLILTFAGDRLGGYLLGSMTKSSQFRYSRLYDQRAEADILLIGNSRGLIFYQPYIEEKTGKSTFNFSYNGMPVDLMAALVKDYYEYYPAPKQMVVDVTLCDRLNNEMLVGFNTYSAYSPRLDSLIIEKQPTMGRATRVTHLFRYNSEIFQRALFYSNKSDEDWLLDRVINQNLQEAANSLEPYQINYQPDTTDQTYLLRHLNDIVRTGQSHGTRVSLVINPYYPPFAQSIQNLTAFREAIEAATGLKVRDYSESIQDVEGFGDYQHLNKNGARQYIDLLLQDGVLE